MCCDLSLCYHSEGSLSACLFDRASNFSANSFSWGDLLALHCWSHVQQILKWSHMSTFICVWVWVWVCVCVCARACMRVCLPMWESKEVVSLQFCACGAHQELDATADILFPIWSPDSSENSGQSLICIMFDLVWPRWYLFGQEEEMAVVMLTYPGFSCLFFIKSFLPLWCFFHCWSSAVLNKFSWFTGVLLRAVWKHQPFISG